MFKSQEKREKKVNCEDGEEGEQMNQWKKITFKGF